MGTRTIKVKIIKETSTKVTVQFLSLNRKMPVDRKDFEKRVEEGLYEVVNPKVSEDKD